MTSLPSNCLAALAVVAEFCGIASADIIYSSEDWEGETTGTLPTVANGTDYVDTADTTDPIGQHGLVQGNINKHMTLTNPMTLATDGVTSLKVDFAIYFNKGGYSLANDVFNLVYSASGDFTDAVVVQVFTTVDTGPPSGPYEYVQKTWYVGQSVMIDATQPGITFTDTAKFRWRKGVGSNGMSSNVYVDDVVITGATPSGPFVLTIAPNDSNPDNYDFTWNSNNGKLYDLVSETDFSTAPDLWPVWNGNADIPASGTGTTSLTNVPGGGDSKRFFAVVEKVPPPPPLLNGSFEDPVKADGEFTTVAPPNWTEFDAGNLGDVGVWNPLVGVHATVPDGENVGQVYHTGVPMTAFGLSQMLGANFAANTAYQVTVEVGRSANFAWPGYRVELWAGATMIKEDANTLTPAADSWATSTVSYTYDAGHPGLVGEPLEIRLLSIGEDPEGAGAGSDFSVEFDNVTFTATGP